MNAEQTFLNDCWFVSALVCMAYHKRMSEIAILPDGSGKYWVKFPKTGWILATPRNPCAESNGVWASVLEVAAATYGASIDDSEGIRTNKEKARPWIDAGRLKDWGDGIEILTGHESTTVTNFAGLAGDLPAILSKANSGKVVLASTGGGPNLQGDHVYSVLGYTPFKGVRSDEIGLVRVRNPHGTPATGHWKEATNGATGEMLIPFLAFRKYFRAVVYEE